MSSFAQWLSRFGFRVWLHVVYWRISPVKYSDPMRRWDKERRKVSSLLVKYIGYHYGRLGTILPKTPFIGWWFPRPIVQAVGWLRSENWPSRAGHLMTQCFFCAKSLWWAMTGDIWIGWSIYTSSETLRSHWEIWSRWVAYSQLCFLLGISNLRAGTPYVVWGGSSFLCHSGIRDSSSWDWNLRTTTCPLCLISCHMPWG